MKIRTQKIEERIIEAELLLDGLFTHANFHPGCMREIHRKRIGKALSAVRSARDILRNDTRSKQWTITTRGKKFNRHGLWVCNAIPEWKCDCGLPFKTKGIHRSKMPTKKEELIERLKEDPLQIRILSPL